MAQIAEDLFLLLLDNASAQPALDRDRRGRLLTAAVLLDLAYACRIRPAVPGDATQAGLLLALAAAGSGDPVAEPAFQLLQRRPLSPASAVSKLRKGTQEQVAGHLERIGQVHRVPLQSKRFRTPYAWPLTNRDRVGRARAQLLSALFDRRPPTPVTAGIVSLLHAADGLGALISLNDRGWRWVHARASEISSGSWVNESPTGMPEMNLAVTASAVRSALA
ncbi:GPP34 family phosphoprotein [Mycolicibacterium sp. P9-64]|uniref:GOLPH3/VPS74 family protein n=1 Tax=Mycolicibacterium sp. P9-64 TaxID=2024612 RepID=UPI0011ED0C26|nr:GPP34 family phosphoprotein [Mycolicibacterium sp. P9-64]KAA0080614.1 GPP34 family phosphoprotein [Mycolicibacterium sp. P9-64]